jgi:hypothetical protein
MTYERQLSQACASAAVPAGAQLEKVVNDHGRLAYVRRNLGSRLILSDCVGGDRFESPAILWTALGPPWCASRR